MALPGCAVRAQPERFATQIAAGAKPVWTRAAATSWYIRDVFMPTTVHIPTALLRMVDRRARALGVSRNRLIVRALERTVEARPSWRPEFIEELRQVDPGTQAAADDLLEAVRRARRSKTARRL